MGKLTSFRTPLAALALFSAMTLAPPVSAQATDPATPTAEALSEAKNHYTKGTQFLNEGSYELAQAELLRAYQLAPNYKVLYNIALCSVQLQDYAGAYRTFEQYAAEGGSALSAARKQEVEKQLEFLRQRTAMLEVTTNVVDADVLIDDVLVGKTPVGKATLVNAGKRRVAIVKRGRILGTRVLTLAGGETAKTTFDVDESEVVRPLAPSGAGSTATSSSGDGGGFTVSGDAGAPTDGAKTPSRSIPWVGWAATGALAAGAVTFGVLSFSSARDLRDQKAQPNPNADDLRRLDSRAGTYALVSDILTGAAVVTGGLSLYLTLKSPRKSDAASSKTNVALSPTGVSLRGTF